MQTPLFLLLSKKNQPYNKFLHQFILSDKQVLKIDYKKLLNLKGCKTCLNCIQIRLT